MHRSQVLLVAMVALSAGLAPLQPEQPEFRQPHEPAPVLPGTLGGDETVGRAPMLAVYREETLAGFRILIDPAALETGQAWRRVRAALLFDLETLSTRLPPDALKAVQKTTIAVTRSTPSRPGWDGASAACLHVSPDWLTANGYDAERAGVVEILNMDKYLLWRAEQPMMLLHELAHAYHLLLENGYDNFAVADAYIAASGAHLYDAVEYILAPDKQTRPAYASSNPQEYFAELTEAYFGRNDYEPFTREDLGVHDPAGYAMIEAVWGVDQAADPLSP